MARTNTVSYFGWQPRIDYGMKLLQENLIRSHAAGLGEPLDLGIALAAVASRLNSLIKGYYGVSVELLEFIRDIVSMGTVAARKVYRK